VVVELRCFLSLGEHINTRWLAICPYGDRLYYCESSYEFFIRGSEDYDSYTAIEPEKILKLPELSRAEATGKAKIQALPENKWSIVHNRR
jgi:hypothetical protein